jgi:TRAP-type C4-dicarboxylate transport system permease small subunit
MTAHSTAGPNAAAPAPVRVLLDVIDRLGRLDGWIGGACLAALTALMIANVATRSLSTVLPFLPGDIPVAWEYSSYLMATAFTFGAAMTLRAGGHIRVGIILTRLGPGAKRWLELVLALVGVAFIGFLALAMTSFTWEAFAEGRTSETSGTRVWIVSAAITFGIILLWLQLVARALQAAFDLPLEDRGMRSGTYRPMSDQKAE